MSETSQNNDKQLVERKVIWKVCLEHLKRLHHRAD